MGSTAAGSPADSAAWQVKLRQEGYRLTPQRQLVLEAVTELGHATPDDVIAAVQRKASGVNASTVYRTLDLLSDLGFISHTHLGHGAPTYHALTDVDHVHLVCRECGSVTEASTDLVAGTVSRLASEFGFRADVNHLALFGVCSACGSA
jgi:Fur family ferric uptake transcriptional regulator